MKEFNLKEEEISGYIVTEQFKKVWKIELDMLEEFIRVCDRHNLKYFADSGTLLGAIRHKGFVPWDDDIDVVMKREDYDKLIKLYYNEFKEPYFLQSAYTDRTYYRGHAQLRNTNTTAILEGEKENVSFNQGIFIDIFPIDEIEKNVILRKFKFYRLKLLRRIYRIKFNKNLPNNPLKKVIKITVRFLIKNMNYLKSFQKYEKICKKVYTKSGLLSKVSFYDSYKKYKNFPISYFEESINVPFENMNINVPKNYDDILKKYYGKDYMIPKRVGNSHNTYILDTENSYKEFINVSKGGKTNENNKF